MQWKRHRVVFSLQQYRGSTKCRGVNLGGASVTRCWNLLCMRRGLEHCSLVCKWSVLGLLLLLLPSSALPAPGARRTLNTPSLQWSRPIWESSARLCPHCCPKLPQCGLWAPCRMEGSWPSHWGSALTKGKLQTSFHPLSPGHCSGDCSCS